MPGVAVGHDRRLVRVRGRGRGRGRVRVGARARGREQYQHVGPLVGLGAGAHGGLPSLALVELEGLEELLHLVGHRVHRVVGLVRVRGRVRARFSVHWVATLCLRLPP